MPFNFSLKSALRKLAVLIVGFTTVFQASALTEYGEMTAEDVNDMALIWIGSRHRSDWTKDLFRPYLMHTFQDGHKTWFFDGFLMIDAEFEEVVDGQLIQRFSLGESTSYPARREHWEYILDKQLGLLDGQGCKALDEAIGELIPILGRPATKHKVILMQCIPRPADPNWGSLDDGRRLDFAYLNDKLDAMKWYTELAIKKFEECNFENIVLDGMYWLREDIQAFEEPMVMAMNPYYHEKGLKSYWIPWYRGFGYKKWKEFGFDMMYMQPGYVFDETRGYDRLEGSCADAWEYSCGIEVEFEACGVEGYDDNRVTKPQGNSCRYEDNPKFFERFKAYIDIIEEEGIFDFMQMAYYNGYQGIYDFAQSTNAKSLELMDRLAAILENRHVASKWYVADNAGLIDLECGDKATVICRDGSIDIKSSTPIVVSVFTVDGINVYNSNGELTSCTVNCNPGLYIVRAGNSTSKVIVK